MVQNESRPVPVMADCQFGDRTKWKNSKSGIQKRTVLEMGVSMEMGMPLPGLVNFMFGYLHMNTLQVGYILKAHHFNSQIVSQMWNGLASPTLSDVSGLPLHSANELPQIPQSYTHQKSTTATSMCHSTVGLRRLT